MTVSTVSLESIQRLAKSDGKDKAERAAGVLMRAGLLAT